MTTADVQGKFLWHELATTDPGGAGAFYSKVLGWKSQPYDKDPSYTVLSNAKGHVGGMMKSPDGSSHWLAYVGVQDLEATVATAQRLGGRVIKPAAQIPDGGRYAVLSDPQNGVIGIFAPPASGGAAPATDEFAWHELATSDHSAAFRFYRELFGWEQIRIHDMGAAGQYLLFGRHGETYGGMFNRPASMVSSWPHWLIYAKVHSAQKAAEAAAGSGGRVVNGPMQVPGGSWIAQMTDPQGAAIAVNQPQPAAAPAAVAKPAAPPSKPAVAAAKPAAVVAPAQAPRPAPAASAAPKPAVSASPPPPTRSAPAPTQMPKPASQPVGATAKPAPAAPAAATPAAPRAAKAAPAAPAKAPRPPAKKAKKKAKKRVKASKKAKKTVKKAKTAKKAKKSARRGKSATRRASGSRGKAAAKRSGGSAARKKAKRRRRR